MCLPQVQAIANVLKMCDLNIMLTKLLFRLLSELECAGYVLCDRAFDAVFSGNPVAASQEADIGLPVLMQTQSPFDRRRLINGYL